MKDIRPDINERIEAAKSEILKTEQLIADMQKELQVKKQHVESLKLLYSIEDERWGSQGRLFQNNRNGTDLSDMNDLIIDVLRHSSRPLTSAEIGEQLENKGVDFEGKAPARAINFRLIGLQQREKVWKDTEHGTWEVKNLE